MTYAIPVIDLENVQLDAVRAAAEELGAVQVVNHGGPGELSADPGRRMARLLALPRADKARLASPHPYRGWRQWPEQIAAWRDGTPYVADLAENSAGRSIT